jgi:hypothetical protein
MPSLTHIEPIVAFWGAYRWREKWNGVRRTLEQWFVEEGGVRDYRDLFLSGVCAKNCFHLFQLLVSNLAI